MIKKIGNKRAKIGFTFLLLAFLLFFLSYFFVLAEEGGEETAEEGIAEEGIAEEGIAEEGIAEEDNLISIYNREGYPISYERAGEREENKTKIYLSFVLDKLEFESLEEGGRIVLWERGDSGYFVSVFGVDTTGVNFGEGYFTKRVEGEELYKCLDWSNEKKDCGGDWVRVRELEGEEYQQPLEKGEVAYGEKGERGLVLGESLGMAGELGIQSAYNLTAGEGLLVYSESTINSPRYRFWNVSLNNFSNELTNTQDIGGDTKWVVIEGALTRDEMLIGTENDQQEIHLQTYNSSGQWGGLLKISTGVPNTGQRAFDIAYEETSGEALIAYENLGSNGDAIFGYLTWNGTSYSAEQSFTTTLTNNAFSWVELVPQKGTDIIMALAHNGAGDLFGVPWNGTAFESDKQQILSEATASNTEQHFAFGWEETSGQGLVGYGEGNNFVYRTYSPTAPYWSEEATIGLGNGLGALRMCSEPNSNYVGIIWQDGGGDVNARMWDGSQLLGSPPSEDAQTEASGANNINVDCVWFNSSTALFGFVDFGADKINYFTFSQTANSWSTGVLTATNDTNNFASGDIKGLRFVKHPSTVEVMALAEDDAEDLHAIRWNGTNFTMPTYTLETGVEVSDSAQEDAMFGWFRYDSAPTITIVSPTSEQVFNISVGVNITVSITDNLNISLVSVNITFPNGTVQQLTVTDENSDNSYNATFNGTAYGAYSLLVAVNDTNNNINTASMAFVLADPNNAGPNVVLNSPANGYNSSAGAVNFNWTAIDIHDINLTCNLTVNNLVNISNITVLNGTPRNYSLSFGNVNYSWSVSCWDPAGTANSSTTRTFVVDIAYPTIQFVNLSSASGNYSLNYLFVNITAGDSYLRIINITLYNSSGLANTTYNMSSPLFVNFTGLVDGAYYLNATAEDYAGNVNATETRAIVLDRTSPVVSLVAPANNTLEQISNSINFVYNATDITSGVKNCSLYFNGSLNETDITVTEEVNQSFSKTLTNREYNWSVRCYDDGGNLGVSTAYNLSVSVSRPTVTLEGPADGYNSSSTAVSFNCSAIDDGALVNVTLYVWNGSGALAYSNMTALSGKVNNSNWTANLGGNQNYTWNCEAYDNAGLSDSGDSNRTLRIDTLYPTVQFGEPSSAGGNYSLGYLFVNITSTDNYLRIINITLYNSSGLANTTYNMSSPLFVNFTGLIDGTYYLNATASDYAGNVNATETRAILLDRVAPAMTLNTPASGYNSSSRTVSFNFTAVDGYHSTLNCSVYINGTINQTSFVTNGTATTFSIGSFNDGSYNWSVGCNDGSGNANTSESRNFTVDAGTPAFNSLVTSPSATGELDPGVNVTVYANVTDNTTGVNIVMLQRKLSSETDYTNLTLIFNTTSLLFYGTFNASSSGTYNLRLWANDTVNNGAFSNTQNLAVELEYTWTRTPPTFTPVIANDSQNITLGNLTVNNTGDYNLSFTIVSDSAATRYNETENFTLVPKEVKTIAVNETAPTGGVKRVTLTISAANGDPASQTTVGNIIVAPNQPVLVASFSTPSGDTLAVTQGDTGIAFVAKLENIGEGNASNATFPIVLGGNWTVTYSLESDLTLEYDTFLAGESGDNVVEVKIPTNATAGTFSVLVNATGYNNSGVNLSSIGLIFGDSVAVTVSALAGQLGTVAQESGATTGGGTSGGGGGGGGAAPQASTKTVTGKELLESGEAFELVRGKEDSFPIEITNIYEELEMVNVRVEVEGYLSQYLKISPTYFERIKPGETKTFTAKIASPTYMERGTYELKFTLKGKLYGEKKTPLTETSSVTTKYDKDFTEVRLITLTIFEVGKEEAEEYVGQARLNLEEMRQAGFPDQKLSLMVGEIEKAWAERNYEKAKELAEEVEKIKERAFEAAGLIEGIKDKIKGAEGKGLGVEETKRLLNLALAAWEREDYTTALARLKEAELSWVIETKGKVNIWYWLRDWWWAILAGGISLIVLGMIAQRKLALVLITRKLEELEKEEVTIKSLMREVQEKTFKEKTMSTMEYHKQMYSYEKRLAEIGQLKMKLRAKQAGIIRVEKALERLAKEDKKVIESMKELQDAYYNKQKITKKAYLRRIEEQRLRRIEIEKAIIVLETKLAKKRKLEEMRAEEKRLLRKEVKKGRIVRLGVKEKIFSGVKIFDRVRKRVGGLLEAGSLFKGKFKRWLLGWWGEKKKKEKVEKKKSRKEEELKKLEKGIWTADHLLWLSLVLLFILGEGLLIIYEKELWLVPWLVFLIVSIYLLRVKRVLSKKKGLVGEKIRGKIGKEKKEREKWGEGKGDGLSWVKRREERREGVISAWVKRVWVEGKPLSKLRFLGARERAGEKAGKEVGEEWVREEVSKKEGGILPDYRTAFNWVFGKGEKRREISEQAAAVFKRVFGGEVWEGVWGGRKGREKEEVPDYSTAFDFVLKGREKEREKERGEAGEKKERRREFSGTTPWPSFWEGKKREGEVKREEEVKPKITVSAVWRERWQEETKKKEEEQRRKTESRGKGRGGLNEIVKFLGEVSSKEEGLGRGQVNFGSSPGREARSRELSRIGKEISEETSREIITPARELEGEPKTLSKREEDIIALEKYGFRVKR